MKSILFSTIFLLCAIGGSHVVNGQIFQQLGLDFPSFGSFVNKWLGFGQKTQDIQPNLQIPVPSMPVPVPVPDPLYVQQYETQPPEFQPPQPLPYYPYPYSNGFEQSQIIGQNLGNPNLRLDPNFLQIEPNGNPFPPFAPVNFKSQRSIRFNDESQNHQNPNGIYSGRKEDQVKAPAEASTEASSTEKMFKIEEDFPCPKMGSWRWDGEYCIAVGVWPTWGCKPLDLIMTGRMGVCRNKFKMNLIHLNKPKEESTKTAA